MALSRVGGALRALTFGPHSRLQAPIIVAVAYYLGAEAAFLIGTLSDNIFAPFWPPNIVLFCALLLSPPGRWWVYLLAAFPAHVLAELGVGMGTPQLLVAFATNALVAALNAACVQKLVAGPPWLDSFRSAGLYILITAVASPMITALAGAFVPILGGSDSQNYWLFWAQWYMSNALGSLTLGPVAIIWLSERGKPAFRLSIPKLLEPVALGVGLVVVCTFAFEIASRQVPSSFLPALLYLPLPLVLWAAFRFGVKGATGAILVVAVDLIWRTLNGPSLFIAETAEMSVFAIQLFLIGLSIPILLLGASIGEAQRAEQEVRDSEERMAFAAVSADVCLWHFDTRSDQFWITGHGRQMLGLRAGNAVTRADIIEAAHHDDREIVSGSLDGSSASQRVVDCEFRVVRPDGQVRWFRSRARSHAGDSTAPTQISGTFADITEQKTAENEIAQQRQEIAHLMRVSMLGELSGGIAHELTQPLSAILSNAEAARILLSRPSFNVDELIDVLDDIIGEDHRAGEVIHRIRGLLTRSEAKFEAVDINALAEASLRLLNAELINRRVKVTLRLTEGLPLVGGDSVQLQQVVLNLVMNAMDAMSDTPPGRRTMTVSSGETSDGSIRLAVSDCGVGLQPSHRERVFQPFFTTKPRGLGLGLSLCRSIIKLHGGVLNLDDNPGGGATATFSLPQLQMKRAAE